MTTKEILAEALYNLDKSWVQQKNWSQIDGSLQDYLLRQVNILKNLVKEKHGLSIATMSILED